MSVVEVRHRGRVPGHADAAAALKEIAQRSTGSRRCGLRDDLVDEALRRSQALRLAIGEAVAAVDRATDVEREAFSAPEADQVDLFQGRYASFYPDHARNPYVALGASGPWIVTTAGGVIYDLGGYGMLGFGHNDAAVTSQVQTHEVMANVMTANVQQLRFAEALDREIGHSRPQHDPVYAGYACLNSGSEAMCLASRIADHRATASPNRGTAPTRVVGLVGGFHGRTYQAAQVSESCAAVYEGRLASFSDHSPLLTVAPNDIGQLHEVFDAAERRGEMIRAIYMEPVMGEGNPGVPLDPGFYEAAVRRVRAQGGMAIVDSVQAGLRAHGVLSIVDYPGFEDMPVPDLEAFSKALNAGAFPLSVLALGSRTDCVVGLYGNTMTTNPRGLRVATAVLEAVTDDVRHTIRDRGREFLGMLTRVGSEMGGLCTGAQGTGLLLSLSIDPRHASAEGVDGLERALRQRGLGLIHGGRNSLRFTPHFRIESWEIDLVEVVLARHLRDVA